jgi:hypothetical protein
MTRLMWHPETGGTFEAHEDAVPHHRASGWLLESEREEHLARAADHPSRKPPAAADGTDGGGYSNYSTTLEGA